MFNPEEKGFYDENLLFASNSIKKLVLEYGKSTPELREAIRKATSLFIHYIIDHSIQTHQGQDNQRPVSIKPNDIYKSLEQLGFSSISRKISNQK